MGRMCNEMLLHAEHEHCNSSGSSGFSHFIDLKDVLGVCLLQMVLLST